MQPGAVWVLLLYRRARALLNARSVFGMEQQLSTTSLLCFGPVFIRYCWQ